MVDPDFLLIAEREGEPIGFCMTTQDFHQAMYPLEGRLLPFGWLKFLLEKRKIRGVRTLLLGVKPEYRGRGVETLLIYETMRYGIRHGFPRGQCSWILEDNVAMNRILEDYGATVLQHLPHLRDAGAMTRPPAPAPGALVAVTGGTGFLGSHVCDLLLAARLPRAHRARAPTSDLRWLRGKPIEWRKRDLGDAGSTVPPSCAGPTRSSTAPAWSPLPTRPPTCA